MNTLQVLIKSYSLLDSHEVSFKVINDEFINLQKSVNDSEFSNAKDSVHWMIRKINQTSQEDPQHNKHIQILKLICNQLVLKEQEIHKAFQNSLFITLENLLNERVNELPLDFVINFEETFVNNHYQEDTFKKFVKQMNKLKNQHFKDKEAILTFVKQIRDSEEYINSLNKDYYK